MMISLERISLFSTHLQGATLSFSLKMWAMGSGSVQHCINSLCVNILLIGPYPSHQCKLNRGHWSCVIALYYSQHILTYILHLHYLLFSQLLWGAPHFCPSSWLFEALIVDSSVFSLLLLVEAVWFSSAKVIYRSKCDQMWLTWLPCRYTGRWKAHASCWWVMSVAVFHIKLLHCYPSYMYLLTSLGHTICFSHAWFTSLDNLDHTFCAELSAMEVEDVQFKQVVSSVDSPLLCFEFHYAAIWFWRMSVPVSIY